MLHLLRKKAFIVTSSRCLLFGFIVSFHTASAQINTTELNLYDHDSKPYYFGITLGANLARFHTELHPRFLQYDSVYVAEPANSGGMSLGLLATARISDRFQLRFNPQLLFLERAI